MLGYNESLQVSVLQLVPEYLHFRDVAMDEKYTMSGYTGEGSSE